MPDVPEFVGIKRDRLRRAKDLLGSDPDLVLPFNAFVAFKETIIPSEMGEFLNQAYDTLCERIISCNNADVSTLLREARRSNEAGDSEQAQATYQQILEANSGDPGTRGSTMVSESYRVVRTDESAWHIARRHSQSAASIRRK